MRLTRELFVASLIVACASAQVPQGWGRITPPLGFPASVNASAVFDDGTGPALYAGGRLSFAGGMAVGTGPIARWNGFQWSGIGAPLQGAVYALAVFDDGSGPALYAGGSFTGTGSLAGAQNLLRWNGTTWSALPGPLSGDVTSMAVHDDGSGPALFVAGRFAQIGTQTVGYVAKWNGVAWYALAGGVGPIYPPGIVGHSVTCLAVHDDGGGPALFAGGNFVNAGAAVANNVARWRSGAWSALGPGLTGGIGYVNALAGFGGQLYAGGTFAGPLSTTTAIARWNGMAWSDVGGGLVSPVNFPGAQSVASVNALAIFDEGAGPRLFAGGVIGAVGAVANANGIARWDGTAWSALGGGVASNSGELPAVGTLNVATFGGATALFAAGHFTSAGPVPASSIARWQGGAWSPLGGGLQAALEDVPWIAGDLVVKDATANGVPRLIMGANFRWLGTQPISRLASWNGLAWGPMDAGLAGAARDFAVVGSVAGETLYAGGSSLWRWTGAAWQDLTPVPAANIARLAAFDDGSGAALYGAGNFGGFDHGVARWTGTQWTSFSVSSPFESRSIASLIARTDANGPALFAAGRAFDVQHGASRGFVWRWNGAAWSEYPSLVDCNPFLPYACSGSVISIEVHDDGSGPALFASGAFNGVGHNRVARWSGSSWVPVGGGLPAPGTLYVHDDGSGPRLHAAVTNSGIHQWTGAAWVLLPNTPIPAAGPVTATTFDDGGGRDVVLGGLLSVGGPAVFGLALSHSALDSHVGETAGVPLPVLRIGTAGGFVSAKSLRLALNQPFTIDLSAPPGAAPAPFALAVLAGAPTVATIVFTPLGPFSMPVPDPNGPSAWLASSVGFPALFNAPPAPWSLPVGGIGFPLTATVQGVIFDPAAPSLISITNGIVVRIGP